MFSALTILLLIFSREARLSALTNEFSLPIASASFYKTSFDCKKAKDYSVEQAICTNDELAKLDLEMADAYKKRLGSVTDSQKSELVLSQRKWLMIRNSFDANPYHVDAGGTLSDIADFYRNRIEALRSGRTTFLNTDVPKEYDWLKAIAPEGFSNGFSVGRGYMGCQDPCKKEPSLYKLISIWAHDTDESQGETETAYPKIVRKLASEGWTKCRSADDSGKPSIDYFKKKDKMIAVNNYASMATGDSITLSITTSGPLSEGPPKMPSNPAVTITSDWLTYSSADMGFRVRYPPGWWVRDDKAPNRRAKYLTFGAKDYLRNFTISIQPEEFLNGQAVNQARDEPGQLCGPSRYRISGFSSRACLSEGENVGTGTCTWYLYSLDIETGIYYLSFRPDISGSLVQDSNRYKLTDLYQKILSTIEMK
jgi:uncharacterized protein YecT (DUF1311 family)